MDFIFIGLTLGCAIFLGKIVVDYRNEVPVWKDKIDRADLEMAQYEAETSDLIAQKESASIQSKTIDDEIKKMESMAGDLKAEIDKTKKEMARKGKIVMRREPE
jgi:chromosome segregation ATPase